MPKKRREVLVTQSSPSATPWSVTHQAPCPWDSPSKSTGVGCHSLLQKIFPIQGSNPGLLHCRQIFFSLSWEDPLARAWQPTPVLFPGDSHGQRSLVGCSPWGRQESDTTECLTHKPKNQLSKSSSSSRDTTSHPFEWLLPNKQTKVPKSENTNC